MDRQKAFAVRMLAVGAAFSALFILFEWVLLRCGAFGKQAQLFLVDSACRFLFGAAALLTLRRVDRDGFRGLFTHRVPGRVWLWMFPIYGVLLLELSYFFCAEQVTFAYFGLFLLCCLQQVATGFYEEAVARGLMMSGMMARKDRLPARLAMVSLSGLLFGAAHILNVLFGQSVLDSLAQGLCSALWGMLIAAVYLCSENLPLVMGIHAVWDIVVRIPGAFLGISQTSALPDLIEAGETVLQLAVMPVTAILMCVFYDRIVGVARTKRAGAGSV